MPDSLSLLNWIKNEMIFYCISVLMLATLIQRYNKKSFHFKNKRLTEILQAVRCQVPPFMIVWIPYINLLNLSWIIKCLFLRNMEPLIIRPYRPGSINTNNRACIYIENSDQAVHPCNLNRQDKRNSCSKQQKVWLVSKVLNLEIKKSVKSWNKRSLINL